MEARDAILTGKDHTGSIDTLNLSLNVMTALLTRNANYLKQINARLEDLTLAVKRIESGLGLESGLATAGPSLQLRQGIAEFVKLYINPQFYQTSEARLVERSSQENIYKYH